MAVEDDPGLGRPSRGALAREHGSGSRLLPQEAEAILASIAGMLGTQIDSEHPIIEAELPLDG